MKVRFRLVPHEHYRCHDVTVTLSLSGDEAESLLHTMNCGLAILERDVRDATAEDRAQYAAERREVLALLREVERRREAAAKVPRDDQ